MAVVAFSTRNPMGRRFTGTFRRPNLRGLGDGLVAPATQAQADALNAGVVTMEQVNQMVLLGAADADFEGIVSGVMTAEQWIAIMTAQSGSAAENAALQSIGASGDPTTEDAAASQPAAWYDLAGQLRQANADIKALEAQVYSDPAFAQAHGREVIALRTEYGDAVGKFVFAYDSIFGSASTPQGLEGLGIAPVIIVAGAAVLFAGVVAAIYAIHAHIESVRQETQVMMAQIGIKQQQQTAAQQLRVQAGNPALSAAARAQLLDQAAGLEKSAGTPPGVQAGAADSFTAFFTANWKWMLGGLAAITILPQVLQAASPKRR